MVNYLYFKQDEYLKNIHINKKKSNIILFIENLKYKKNM